MLRRSFLFRAPVRTALHTAAPIYETLQSALATSRFDSLSAPQVRTMCADLHQHHIHFLGCWRDADLATRQKFADMSDQNREAARILDFALERAEEQIKVPKILIAYGSQTGSAEALARWTGVIAKTNTGLVPIIISMNDAAKYLQTSSAGKDNIVASIFVTSSYGVGSFPLNAEKFMQELKAGKLSRLGGIPHSVFGLGNSNNPQNFNAAAKELSAELKKAGSKELTAPTFSCELEDEGHDAAFRTWKSGLWSALDSADIAPKKAGVAGAAGGANGVEDIYDVEFIFANKAESLRKDNGRRLDWFEAPVTWNMLMTPKGYAPRFREMTVELNLVRNIDILGRKIKPNDVLLVHPKNPRATVDRALKHFGYTGEEIIEVMPRPGAPSSFFDGKKIAVRTFFKEVMDFSKMPTRSVLLGLVSAAQDESQRAALLKLATDTSSGNEFSKLTAYGKHLTILDILERFPSVKLSLAQIATRLPHIQPRKYSNAKTPYTMSNHFEICYRVPEVVPGLATTTMESCVPGSSSLWCSLEEGKATMPPSNANAVFIGLGSGIGLVRSALQARALAKAKGETIGKCTVIAGCRRTDKDQLFKEELQQFVKDGIITDLRLVGSYDKEGSFDSPFDQLDGAIVKDLIEDKTIHLMYCGVGGSVPRYLDAKLRANNVDIEVLRQAGRYHEEYFTTDLDSEKLYRKNQKQ